MPTQTSEAVKVIQPQILVLYKGFGFMPLYKWFPDPKKAEEFCKANHDYIQQVIQIQRAYGNNVYNSSGNTGK